MNSVLTNNQSPQPRAMSTWLIFVCIASLFFMSGCSSKVVGKREKSEQQYYEEAREALEENNLLVAGDRLRELETYYPFGEFADQARLELIYVDYMTSNLEGALIGAEKFARLNPLHPQADYAYYMRGLATYEMGFGFVDRYLSDAELKRDPAPLEDAFTYFDQLIKRYPNSSFVPDARKRMLFLRDRLASYDLSVARYYMKRHAYIAAANRALDVVTRHQQTTHVGDALALMTEAYQILGLEEEAERSLQLLKHNYPMHPQLETGNFEASGLVDTDRRTLMQMLTFGLVR